MTNALRGANLIYAGKTPSFQGGWALTANLAAAHHPRMDTGAISAYMVHGPVTSYRLLLAKLIERCLMSHRMLWTAALVLFFAVGLVAAQEPKPAVGPVAKIGGTMLVVDTGGGKSLQFITSTKTTVKMAAGGGRTEECKDATGKPCKITDVVRVGDQVSVKYADVSGKLMAESIDVLNRRPDSAQKQK